MKKSESLANLAAALVKAQSEITFAKKDAKNPFFKSSYSDLPAVIDAIKVPLNKHGISFLQLVNLKAGQPVIDTVLLHVSGEFITSRTPVIVAKANDPQSLGSAITYAKRYGLQAIVGVPADEDDDGEAAMGRKTQKPQDTTVQRDVTPQKQYIASNSYQKPRVQPLKPTSFNAPPPKAIPNGNASVKTYPSNSKLASDDDYLNSFY